MCDSSDGDVLAINADPEAETGSEAGRSMSVEAPSHAASVRSTLTIASLVLVVDHLSKWWAQSRLEPGICSPETCLGVFGTRLRFHLVHNTGAAFSMGEGFGWLIAPLAFVMAGALLLVARQTSDRWSLIALGLIVGGALGNMIDRVIRAEEGLFSGGVVDFIDFQFWPVFNVADMAVVGGVGLLVMRQASQSGDVAADDVAAGDVAAGGGTVDG